MFLYLAAPAYSLLSERGTKPLLVTSPGDIDGRVIPEIQAARWSVALVAILLSGFLIFSLIPQPTEPIYARYAPSVLKPGKVFKVHPIKGNSNGNNGNSDKPPKKPK
jgi:hypothetical protein